ncbi:MAG: tyrosine-protein phosphatase [Atopobiaceae bacterium]|jgi:protein-tyrosine phosphatase
MAGTGTQARENFGHIDFSGLPNTRDLGGLETLDGRHVVPRRLLRSGALGFASDDDLARLREDYGLRAVIDFRDDDELAEYPDPMHAFPAATYLHADVLRGRAVGITQSEAAKKEARLQRLVESDPAAAMAEFYTRLVVQEPGPTGYSAFLRTLLATGEGAVLWHCTMGRDRAGIASVVVESILGVPRDLIEQDYLATNDFYEDSAQDPFRAQAVSIDAAFGAVEERYGGMGAYVERALGITPAECETLRERYLA